MKKIWTTVKILILYTILLGVLYPLFITVLFQTLFPNKTGGSIIYKDNNAVGSALIGQSFSSDKYFWPRPSAISNNPLPSGASNLSLTSKLLKKEYDERVSRYRTANNPGNGDNLPQEMFFASASGVDPDISPLAAYQQIERISKARSFNEKQKVKLYEIVNTSVNKPKFGFLGRTTINVFLLNLLLDKIE